MYMIKSNVLNLFCCFIQKIKFKKEGIFIADLLDPKNDYVFKRIFGYSGNEEITKSLLNSIIPDNIKEIELDCNPITEKDLLDDKVGILDIKAKLNNNLNCNIEMQVCDYKDIEKRLLFYWSKMYSGSIKSGEPYSKLERTIVILISDYNLEKLRKIPEYITKWNIREEKYPKIILTDVLEVYIIELNKAKVSKIKAGNMLESWLQFINNPKEKSSMENQEIEKAKKVLEEISADEHERWLSEMREKHIRDQLAIEEAGYDKGSKATIEQVVKKMKLKGFELETIMEITGLAKEEIDNILS